MKTNRRAFFQQLARPLQQAGEVKLTDVDPLHHLLKRATWGITPDMLAHAQSIGADAWLEEQLNPAELEDSKYESEIRLNPMWTMTRQELYDGYYDKEYEIPYGIIRGVLAQAIHSEKQLLGRMTDFWRDHFSISEEIDYQIELMAFEKNVLEKHALGKFRDILIASAKNPAMLVYLDNFVSSKEAPNENYARELLELHTLGVDGPYTEEDIREVARAFTGWTIHFGTKDGFFFDDYMHDTEGKTFLGKSFPAGRGVEDGLHVLSLLARHPSTARFVSSKLIRRFVADKPPATLVDSTTQVWLESDGDIKAILRHIFKSAEFASSAGQKYMRPFEYVVAMFRATENEVSEFWAIEDLLLRLGQYPHGWHPPNGYPDVAGAWINTGGLLNRWNAAMLMTHGAHESLDDGWGFISRIQRHINEPQTAGELVDQIATRLWGAPIQGAARDEFVAYASDGAGADAPMTKHTLSRKMTSTFGLMMASPAFQWR